MLYLFPADNLLTAATNYTPTPHSITTRTSATKTGGGVVSLTGEAPFDATYEIEIVNNTIVGTPTVSAPTFTGVGNPELSLLAATAGTAAQTFTATLVDLGTDTTFAFLPFQGVTLRAKTSGSGGNAIVIAVNESGIVRTGTDYALIEPLVQGNNEYVGDQWNFGAVVLNADGTIPSTAPRISFGADPQVYRQYKEFSDGRYVYRFSPSPVRDVQEGSRVKTVTGSRVVTMTSGMTVRTYNTITTLYSLLNAVVTDASALVDVVEPVTVNTAPGGMASVEMSVRTVSYVQSVQQDGTVFVRNAELAVSVSDTAPTEILTITCAAAEYTGAEVWNVRGTVSGELADAVTNVAYDGSNYDFIVPQILPPVGEPAADEKSAAFEPVTRADGEATPILCIENFVLGADARNRVYTFVYRTRPPECNCDGVEISGGPDGGILGTEEEAMGELIPSDLRTRVQTLYSWLNTFVASNTSIQIGTTAVTGDVRLAPDGTVLEVHDDLGDPLDGVYTNLFQRVSAVVKVDRIDIDAARAAVGIFMTTLQDVYETNSNSMPSAAGTEWDSALTDLQTDFSAILTNTGANWWRAWSAYLVGNGPPTNEKARIAEANQHLKLLSDEFDAYLERYRARMDKVKTLGNVQPDFNQATRRGNDVWRDHNLTAWFESMDGLLPLQPGHYFYPARVGADGLPVATREFGIGVGFGCGDSLKNGDVLRITINPVSNVRVTYQVGDQFKVAIIKGAPANLGGGQTGTDTQTWRVKGSVAGALTNYSVYKPSPSTYSGGGLTFKITPGGIASALGDEFGWYIEGGQFRHRKNGGSWSSNIQIAPSVSIDTASDANIAATFLTGAAPSFVVGDRYAFNVVALSTQSRICSPVHGGIFNGISDPSMRIANDLHMADPTSDDVLPTAIFVRTTGNCQVIFTPADALGVPDGAAVSYDCVAGDNYIDITADLRPLDFLTLLIEVANDGGDYTPVTMLWLGHPMELDIPNGLPDAGITRKKVRFGTRNQNTARLGASIQHSAVTEQSFDEFIEKLNDAKVNHEGRFALAWPAGIRTESGIVRLVDDDLDVEDELDYQPTNSSKRLLKFTIPMEPVQ
jgi:hypothetical protein